MKFRSQLFLTLCCLIIGSSSVFSFDEESKDRISPPVKSAIPSLDLDSINLAPHQQAAPTSLSTNPPKEAFDMLPAEIWSHIAKSIPGDDLHNYLLTCKSIYDVCIKDPSLTSAPHPDQLFGIINTNGFRGLRNLTLIWKLSKERQNSFFQAIQHIISTFSDHTYTYDYEEARAATELEYTLTMRNFTIDAKCKFLLYHLGDPHRENILTNFKQSKLRQYFDWPEGIENYPYAFRWIRMQVTLCHPNAFNHLYPETGEQSPLNLHQEKKEALRYKASFMPFLHLMSLFKAPLESTDVFPKIES